MKDYQDKLDLEGDDVLLSIEDLIIELKKRGVHVDWSPESRLVRRNSKSTALLKETAIASSFVCKGS